MILLIKSRTHIRVSQILLQGTKEEKLNSEAIKASKEARVQMTGKNKWQI